MVLRYLKDEGKYLLVAGFSREEGNEAWKVFDWIRNEDPAIQVFDARSIAGWQHVYYAVVNAMSAFRTGKNIARSLSMEMLLYVSCQDQIEKAIQTAGLKNTTSDVCLVVVANSENEATEFQEQFQRHFNLVRRESVLKIQDDRKLEHLKGIFSISDLEMKALVGGGLSPEEALRGLIIERGALVVTKR